MLGVPSIEPEPRQTRAPHSERHDPRLRKQAERLPAVDETPVSTIMSTSILSFTADTSIETATRAMLERGISGAPVVDGTGRPIGVISKTDLLEAWHEHSKRLEKEAVAVHVAASDSTVELAIEGAEGPATNIVVGDIMVPYLLAVASTAPVSLAAALMAYEGVHRLLVLDAGNKMVGVVSTLDVLRWLAQLSGFCMPHYTQRQRA